jgi:hypothetical protein
MNKFEIVRNPRKTAVLLAVIGAGVISACGSGEKTSSVRATSGNNTVHIENDKNATKVDTEYPASSSESDEFGDTGNNVDYSPKSGSDAEMQSTIQTLCNVETSEFYVPVLSTDSVHDAVEDYLKIHESEFDQLGLGGGLTPEKIADATELASVTIDGAKGSSESEVNPENQLVVKFDQNC